MELGHALRAGGFELREATALRAFSQGLKLQSLEHQGFEGLGLRA